MSAAKAVLRDTLRRVRATLDSPYREQATARVNTHILNHPAVCTAQLIGAYAATTVELNIDPVIAHLIATHGQVFLPRVVNDRIEFCAVTTLDDLKPGYAGIREPSGPVAPVDAFDCLLVPGVGFDHTGQRLGHGAGHYDRVLTELAATCITMGVAFTRQIVREIPTEPHDRGVQFVVTEAVTYGPFA